MVGLIIDKKQVLPGWYVWARTGMAHKVFKARGRGSICQRVNQSTGWQVPFHWVVVRKCSVCEKMEKTHAD